MMKKLWYEVTNRISKEQGFLVFLYLAFTAYLKHSKSDVLKKSRTDGDLGGFRQMSRMFQGSCGSDLKKSVHDFEESIPWESLLEDAAVRCLLEEVQRKWENRIQSVDDLERAIGYLEALEPDRGGMQMTPESVNQLIAGMPMMQGCARIADFFCGLSGSGICIYEEFRKTNRQVELTGIEQRRLYCDISRIRMFCHGIQNPRVLQENILKQQGEESFDFVIADLPKGNNESIYVGNEKEFLGDKEKVFMEWVAIQRILNRVKENGKAVIIATKGALVRQREKSIRKILTDRDWLEAVVTLPGNLYTATNLGFELLIFNKSKMKEQKSRVFFADLCDQKRENRDCGQISRETAKRLKQAYTRMEEQPFFSAVVSLDEIREQECSWNPLLYLQRNERKEQGENTTKLENIADIMRGVQLSKAEEEGLAAGATHYWLNIRNLGSHGIVFDEASMLRAKEEDWEEKFGILEDDILITSKGAVLKVCMVERGMPRAFLCGNLTRIRVNKEKYNPYILYEYLHSDKGRAALESIQSGTTIKVLNNTNLKKLPVPDYKNGREKGEELRKAYQEFRTAVKEIRKRFEEQRTRLLSELD